MHNRKLVYSFLIVLLAIYNFVFWGEKLGINLFLFLIPGAIAILITNKNELNRKTTAITLFSLILCITFVVINNSVFSKISVITSFIILTGFVHQKGLRTVYSSFLTTLSSLLLFPYNVVEEIRAAKNRSKPFAALYRFSKIAALPVIVFMTFYALYANANPLFNSYSVSFWGTINDYLYKIFEIYPIERVIFLILGLFLISGFVINRNINLFSQFDRMFLDNLCRDKKNKVYGRTDIKSGEPKSFRFKLFRLKMNSLITERNMGVILLVMVNVLLLVVNILDIRFTWFGFDPKEVDNLAYYVHHGTYVLIFSISLSMFILLYLFRGSQNFYNNNRFMKYLAFVWIFQNVIMAVSVFIRNFYYIQYYFALSYKRIGVIIFLILVFIGLITMFVKIYNKKTTFYLFKVNSLAAFIMLILMSSYSWDPQIAEFNLSNPDKDRIDIHYLMCLSDDTLPILDMNRDVLDKNYFYYRNKFNGLEELERRKAEFFAEQGRCTWLSWNLSDNSVKKYFSNIKTGGSS